MLVERQNSWNYSRADLKQYISCNNGVRLQEFNSSIRLCVKEFMCNSSGLSFKWNILYKVSLNPLCGQVRINFSKKM
jgi:hypothetical protein